MIHELADVQSGDIGKNTSIWQYTIVLKHARIGDFCNINCHVFIENDVIIGDFVTVKSGVYIWDGIRIENNVFIGPNVTFNNDPAPRSRQFPLKFLTTVIKNNVSIGSGSNILGGITVGEYSMIGAGSLVTKNIPAFQLWYGTPAMHKGYITKTGVIISMDLVDKEGRTYSLINGEPLSND